MTRIKVSTKSKRPLTAADQQKMLRYAAQDIGTLVLNGEYVLAEAATAPAPIPINSDSTAHSLVAAAKQIAERRAEKLRAMRTLLREQQNEEALMLARELCGLREDQDETSNRTHSRQH